MKTPILQFGTSRFLQAHVDLFVSEALTTDQAVGPITVVKTTAGSERAGRLAGLVEAQGFPVMIRGLIQGSPVDREYRVHSVRRALSAQTDWAQIERIFAEEVSHVVSNAGDNGYSVPKTDLTPGGARSSSFPGKLLDLLWSRHTRNARPLTIFPCELVSRNGEVLRDIIVSLAARRGLSNNFIQWLQGEVIWVCSLVDRIVSEPIEPAGAVAEPYALWAIESQPGLTLPCQHSAIQIVESLDAVERLKLHILNLGHTLLADHWLKQGRPANQTVRQVMRDDSVRSMLDSVFRNEVLPGFGAHGLQAEAEEYWAASRDRFDNPYLNHHLCDIAGNHAEKVRHRIAAFLDWSKTAGDRVEKPLLTGICKDASGL